MQVAPSVGHDLWLLNFVQVTESISGSVVPLAMFLYIPAKMIKSYKGTGTGNLCIAPLLRASLCNSISGLNISGC